MKWNINCRKVILFANSITFITLILSILALLDISQSNEANLDNEWIVLQVSFIWFLMVIITNFVFSLQKT